MKKLLTFILCATMLIGLIPAFGMAASAETDGGVYIGLVKLNDRDYLLQGAGEPITYSELGDSFNFMTESYAFFSDNTLYLNNFSYIGPGYAESGERPAAIRGNNINLSIRGDNYVTCSTENAVGFRIGGDFQIVQTTTYREDYRDSSLTVNATYGIMVNSLADSSGVSYTQHDDLEVILNVGKNGRGIAVGYNGYGDASVDILHTNLTITNISDEALCGIETMVTGESNYELVNIVGSNVSIMGCTTGIDSGNVNIYDSEVAITTDDGHGINARKNVSDGNVTLHGSSIDIFVANAAYFPIRAGDTTTYNTKTMKTTKGGFDQKELVMKPVPYVAIGDVILNDGDYLASGAITTTTTKPAGGYAYYTDDIGGGYLELNNFTYVGEGYDFSYRATGLTRCTGIYSSYNLQITSKGVNNIEPTRTSNYAHGITVLGSLVLQGDGETSITCNDAAICVMSDTASDEADLIISSGKWIADGLYGAYVRNYGLNKNTSITISGGDLDMKYGIYLVNEMNGDSVFTVNGGNVKIYDDYQYATAIVINSNYVSSYVQNAGNVTVESDGCTHYISVGEYENSTIDILGGVLVLTGNTTEGAFLNKTLVFGEDMGVVEGELGTGYAKIANINNVKLGDVNGDGKINSLDAAWVLKHDAMIISLDDTQLDAADVNGDGKVNSLDAAQILKLDAGIIKGF